MRILFVFVFIASFISYSYAGLTLEDIDSFDWVEPQKGEMPSPLLGILAIKSGILENIRFHGNYGKEDGIHTCHRQIGLVTKKQKEQWTKEEIEKREAQRLIDCPHDYTTSLIQFLFPSVAGRLLANQTDDWVGKKLATNFQLMKIIFEHIKKGYNQKWEESEEIKSLTQQLSQETKSKNYNRDIAGFASTLVKALRENRDNPDLYPPRIIEATLLAFLWKKAKSIDDVKGLFPLSSKDGLDEEFYTSWLNLNVSENHQLSKGVFTSLWKDPKKLIFLTLGEHEYADPYPFVLGMDTAVYTYQGEGIKFPDCGEISLRNFFNLMLADPKTRKFDFSLLKEKFPDADPELLNFFEEIQSSYHDVNKNDMRDKWASVVSNLNERKKLININIDYKTKDVCEIYSRYGFENMFLLIAVLLNDKEMLKLHHLSSTETMTGNQKRAFMLNHLLKQFSREGTIFSWETRGSKEDTILQHTKITLLINGQKQFVWLIEPGHISLLPLPGLKYKDWRQEQVKEMNIFFTKEMPLLKNWILPFYMNDHFTKSLYNGDKKEELETSLISTASLIYGNKLSTDKNRLAALDFALTNNPKCVRDVAVRWVSQSTQDTQEWVFCLMYKHAQFFSNKNFKETSPGKLYADFIQRLKKPKSSNDLKEIAKLFGVPFAEKLLVDVITREKFQKFHKTNQLPNKQTLLHLAAKYGYVKLLDNLLEVKGIITSDTIQDSSGNTPLHLAVESGDMGVVNKLIENKEFIQVLLENSNLLQNKEGNTPLHLAAILRDTSIASLLMENESLKELLLSKLKNNEENTPLHLAAKFGRTFIVKLFLKNPMFKKVLLSSRNFFNADGDTCLHLGVFIGGPDVVKELLRSDIIWDENTLKNPETGQSPLHEVIKSDQIETMQVLLDPENKVRDMLLSEELLVDYKGKTPLHLIGEYGHVASFETLVYDRKAKEKLLSPNLLRTKGKLENPLILAIKDQHAGIVEMFLEDPDTKTQLFQPKALKDAKLNTPLHIAVSKGNSGIVEMLLEDDDLRKILLDKSNWFNDFKKTPLTLAGNKGEIQKTIRQAMQKNKSGCTNCTIF